MSTDAKASKQTKQTTSTTKKRRRRPPANRTKDLMLATDSAIERLEIITRPGGDIEQMDIKELKNLISSIRDLASVSAELGGTRKECGGVVILPEVQNDV